MVRHRQLSKAARDRAAAHQRVCHRDPPQPCDCKPGDLNCGRYKTSIASLPAKRRRGARGDARGGYRTPADNKNARRAIAKRRRTKADG